ncbi:MAG: hypothetical protein V4574_03930 [Pseudomonadota bacterium]
MADNLDGFREDIAIFTRLLADPAGLRALASEHSDFLRDEEDAREFVESLLKGFDDVLHGRVVPHEQVVRDMEERRRRYRATAAE